MSSNVIFSVLQVLPTQFGTYLSHNICQDIVLCGDSGDNQTFNIVVQNNIIITTCLGPSWNVFCRRNKFRPDCTVRFKFALHNCYVCHVYRISM